MRKVGKLRILTFLIFLHGETGDIATSAMQNFSLRSVRGTLVPRVSPVYIKICTGRNGTSGSFFSKCQKSEVYSFCLYQNDALFRSCSSQKERNCQNCQNCHVIFLFSHQPQNLAMSNQQWAINIRPFALSPLTMGSHYPHGSSDVEPLDFERFVRKMSVSYSQSFLMILSHSRGTFETKTEAFRNYQTSARCIIIQNKRTRDCESSYRIGLAMTFAIRH